MAQEHYFSTSPESPNKPKKVEMVISGKNVTLNSASGTFSPGQLDVGTKILLDYIHLAPKTGNVLDLGCGWGPIVLSLAQNSPEATVFGVDVNQRALQLTEENAKLLGISNIKTFTPEDFPSEVEFDGIWSNPPIRIGKPALHELLLTWIPRLRIGAEAFLVVQKNLGSDSLQKWLNQTLAPDFEVSRLATEKTYRLLVVKRLS
jgi:16S rRNA (guanine1207-N2)-methyltransferase